jgi:hypothetical protein
MAKCLKVLPPNWKVKMKLELKNLARLTYCDAYLAIQSISPAQPGDKTLIDALHPAVLATYQKAAGEGKSFYRSA